MTERISYSSNGDRLFFLDGIEVDEATYHFRTHRRDANVFEDMIRSGLAPHCISDQTFMRGHDNGSQFEGNQAQGDFYKKITEANGGNTNGKRYLSGLANFPGDPEAWVSGRDDVKRLLEKRGWASEGAVTVAARESIEPPEPRYDVADDIVDGYTHHIADRLPDPDLVDRAHLREQVKERIRPKKHQKAPRSEVLSGVLGN